MKALTPSILPQTMSWNPGAEKAPLSFLLLGVVYCHVVIEDHKQEKRHAQHVGEDGELHVRDHPDQLQPTPTLQTHKLEVGDLRGMSSGVWPGLRSWKLPLTGASYSQTSAICTLTTRGPWDPVGNDVGMKVFGKLQRAG